MAHKTKWFGYILYLLVATGCFLYLRFPSDVVKDYVISAVNKSNIPVTLSMNRVTPWPTLGLKVDGAGISLKDSPEQTLFKADNLIVRPEIWSFVRGSGRYCFTCLAYRGHARGCVQLHKKGTMPPFHAEMELKDVRIGGHAYLEELAGRKIQGRLTGSISYNGEIDNSLTGEGEANLRLANGTIELLVPLLELDSIAFNEIVVDAALKNKMITIARCELSGSQLKGNLSGTISLSNQVESSALELRGELEPFAALFTNTEGGSSTMQILKRRLKRGALRFVIRGTLREPKIRFI